jgi:uncharacterized membrane protein (DUF106 family)
MPDAVVKFCKSHAVGLIVALFSAGSIYAKVVVDMSELQDNYTELREETDDLKRMGNEKQITLQKLLTNQEWIMRQLGGQ